MEQSNARASGENRDDCEDNRPEACTRLTNSELVNEAAKSGEQQGQNCCEPERSLQNRALIIGDLGNVPPHPYRPKIDSHEDVSDDQRQDIARVIQRLRKARFEPACERSGLSETVRNSL